jgi:hypothetical protein
MLPRPSAVALRIEPPLVAGGFGWNEAVALRDETRKVLEPKP